MAVRAQIVVETGLNIPCMFNPSEFGLTKAATWHTPPSTGKDTSGLQFQQGQAATMSLNLTFDTTDTGEPVTKHTDRLLTLVTVDPQLPGFSAESNKGRPPWCMFVWGSFVSFKAVVESVHLTFTYFGSDGTPLRAKTVLSLKQFDGQEKWPQNPTSGTPHPHSVRWLLPGQTLDRIAAEVYGDPGKWRLIADANGILDPLKLPEGTPILVPTIEAGSRG
jgi:hypothetical protein